MYVCMYKSTAQGFQNCFGVLFRLCQGKGISIVSTDNITECRCNTLLASYGLGGPALDFSEKLIKPSERIGSVNIRNILTHISASYP